MLTKSNWVSVGDGFIHKKCPKKKNRMSDEDLVEYNSLKDKIKYYAVQCPRGVIAERTMNFQYAMSMVKQMFDDGYTYSDIEYALNVVVKEQDGFWGIGAVKNRIDVIIQKRDNNAKIVKKLAQKEVKKEEVSFDLIKLLGDDGNGEDDEW